MRMHGLGDASTIDPTTADTLSTSTDWSSISNIVQSLGSALTTYQLEQINLTRAQQGLAPISSQSVAPQVNVGLSSSTMVMVGLGLAALVGVLAMGRKR